MEDRKRVASFSLEPRDIELLTEMASRSGWRRGQLLSVAIRFLYCEQFYKKVSMLNN